MSNHVCGLSDLWCPQGEVQEVEQENDADSSDKHCTDGTFEGYDFIAFDLAILCSVANVSPVHDTPTRAHRKNRRHKCSAFQASSDDVKEKRKHISCA
jgi:hypothetical protein